MGYKHADPINWSLFEKKSRELGITSAAGFYQHFNCDSDPNAPSLAKLKKMYASGRNGEGVSAVTRIRLYLQDCLDCNLLTHNSKCTAKASIPAKAQTKAEGFASSLGLSVDAGSYQIVSAIEDKLSPRQRLGLIDALHQQGQLRPARYMAKWLYKELHSPAGKSQKVNHILLGDSALWIARTNMSLGYSRQATWYVLKAIKHYKHLHDHLGTRNNMAPRLANAYHTLHASYRISEEFENAVDALDCGFEYIGHIEDKAKQQDMECWFLDAQSTLLIYIHEHRAALKSGIDSIHTTLSRPSKEYRIRPATFIRTAESHLLVADKSHAGNRNHLLHQAEKLFHESEKYFDPSKDGWAYFLYTRTRYLFHKVRRETEEASKYLELFFQQVISKSTGQIHQRIYVMRAVKEWPEACPLAVFEYLRSKYTDKGLTIQEMAHQEEMRLMRARSGKS